MSSFADRFSLALNNKGISAYKFSKEAGLNQSTVSHYKSGKNEPRPIVITQIAQQLGVNREWLAEGKGDMYSIEDVAKVNVKYPLEQILNKNGNVFEEYEPGKHLIYVKKVPVKAFGSYLSHYNDEEYYKDLKEVAFPVDHIGRGNYICFEVKGDSMNGGRIDDTIDGAQMLCRELGRQHWRDGFRDSQYGWVIVHKETVLFKDIKDLNTETGELTLSSRSGLPQHADFTVNINDVMQIWKVIKRFQ